MVTSPVVVNPNVGESPTCSPLSTFVPTPLLVSVMVPCSPLERTGPLTIPLGNCSLPLIIPLGNCDEPLMIPLAIVIPLMIPLGSWDEPLMIPLGNCDEPLMIPLGSWDEPLIIPLGNCSLPLIIPIPKFCMDEVVTEVIRHIENHHLSMSQMTGRPRTTYVSLRSHDR